MLMLLPQVGIKTAFKVSLHCESQRAAINGQNKKIIIKLTGGYAMIARLVSAFLFIFLSQFSLASSSMDQEELDLHSSIDKLDRINYLPALLPVIFRHSDFIGLTKDQLQTLEHWRTENREPMLDAMKQIARKRIEIKQAALSPNVSSARLQQMQNEIFRLQREVLDYKLSCRDHVLQTFNEENWISFYMVLADEDIGVSVPVEFAEK
jgi:hypothetical protein